MKHRFATLIALSFAVQVFAGPLQLNAPLQAKAPGSLQSRALMPAPVQAPIGMLPYTGVPTGASIPTPYYGQAYQGIQPQLATGSYAYTPAMPASQLSPMGAYGNNGAMANPQMCAMNPQMCMQMNPQMYAQMAQMGGMAGTQMGAAATPTLNPQMLMAALAALPGLAYDMTRPSPGSSSTSATEYERYRPSRARDRIDIAPPIPPERSTFTNERSRREALDRRRDRPTAAGGETTVAGTATGTAAGTAERTATGTDERTATGTAERTATGTAERTATGPADRTSAGSDDRTSARTERTAPGTQLSKPPPATSGARRELPPPEPVERQRSETSQSPISRNEVTTTIGRIDSHNQTQMIATSPGSRCVPDPSCLDCVRDCQSLRSEVCTASNNYFEKIVAADASDGAIRIAKNHSASAGTTSCIREAMKSVNNDRIQFVSCPSSGAALGDGVARPCASDNMAKTMAGAYELVSDCLAGHIDSRADQAAGASIRAGLKKSMFQLWNYESGWAPNAAKKTAKSANGGGPGQLVQPIIETINSKNGADPSRFEQLKSYIASSRKKSCQALAGYDFKPLRADRKNACDRIAMDNGNPILNMMYSMAFMKILRGSLYQTAASVDGVQASTRERVINDLMIWGQGSGGEAISVAFQKVAKTHGSKLSGQPNEQKYQDFMVAMQKEVKSALQDFKQKNPRAAIDPDSDSTYLERTQTELTNLNQRVNGNCGVF